MQVTWIKLTVSIFDDEKIKLIEAMPDKDAIIVIWIKLLCQAGKTNAGGEVYMMPGRPYTDEELAAIFNRPVNTIRLALKVFASLGMIEVGENNILLPNFVKHQNCDRLEIMREQGRERVQRFREKKRLMASGEAVTPPVTLQPVTSNAQIREDKIREDKIREDIYTTGTPYSPPKNDEITTTTTISEELSLLFDVYVNNIGQITPMIADELEVVEKKYPAGWFEEAVKEAVKNNSRRLAYVTAILDRWLVDGFKVDKKGAPAKSNAHENPGKFQSGPYAHLVQR